MKKNLFIAVIAAAAMGGVLASCGSTSSAPVDTTYGWLDGVSYSGVSKEIVVWSPAEEQKTTEGIVAAYNARQTEASKKFNIKYVAVSEADGGTTLGTDPKVTGYPSLVAVADDQINSLNTKNYITPLSGKMLERIKAANSDFSIDCVTNNSKVCGFPISAGNGCFMWYDTSLAGTTDMTDLSAILRKAKELGKKVSMKLDDGWYAAQFFLADGVGEGKNSMYYQKDDEGKTYYHISWDSEANVSFAKKANELLQPYYEDGTLVLSDDNAKIQNGFNGGNYLAAESGLWMEKLFTNKNMGAVELPKVDGHHLGSFSGSKALVVNSYASTEEQVAALYLGELLTSKGAQLLRYTNRAEIPCNKEAIADPAYTQKETVAIKAFVAQSNYAAVQSKSAESRYWDPVGKACGQALADGILGQTAENVDYTWQTFLTAKCELLRSHQ